MAAKLRINYVKSTSSTSLLVKVRVKNDISPYRWLDFLPTPIETLAVWYRVNDDPTEESHVEVTPYKTKKSESGNWTWQYYKLTGLSAGMKYHIVATGVGVNLQQVTYRYFSKVTVDSPTLEPDGSMFCIENENYEWEDFTSCITVPDYKVNNTDITEEWEDANYNVHSSVVQTKVKGSVNLKFIDRLKLNRFLKCLNHNEETYGKGHIRLKLQVNNELDFEAAEDIGSAMPTVYIEFFKIGWEPDWALPFYGTSHEYSSINFSVEEIED